MFLKQEEDLASQVSGWDGGLVAEDSGDPVEVRSQGVGGAEWAVAGRPVEEAGRSCSCPLSPPSCCRMERHHGTFLVLPLVSSGLKGVACV